MAGILTCAMRNRCQNLWISYGRRYIRNFHVLSVFLLFLIALFAHRITICITIAEMKCVWNVVVYLLTVLKTRFWCYNFIFFIQLRYVNSIFYLFTYTRVLHSELIMRLFDTVILKCSRIKNLRQKFRLSFTLFLSY